MKMLKTLAPWLLQTVFAVSFALSVAAQSSSEPRPSSADVPPRTTLTNRMECAHVRLETNELEQMSVFVDDVLVTTLKRLREAGGTLLTNCVNLRVTDDPDGVQVWANCRKVCFGGWGFDGWEAQIPQGSQLTAKPDFKNGTLDVFAPNGNPTAITLSFIDGASVQLTPGTGGRVDVMGDRTYVFTARGEVMARSGEGKELALSDNALPLTGGPMVEIKDANGQPQRVRLSPTVSVAVSGAPGSDYVVKVGTQEVRVGAGQSRTVSLPNGTGIILTQDPSGGALVFSVSKGDFRLAVNGLEGTQVVGLTGQNGVLSWSAADRWLDLGNAHGTTPMVVGLPGGASAGVAGQGGGRFALKEGSSFEALARGSGLTVVAEGAPGWSAQVPGSDTAAFNLNPASRLVDVTAGTANKTPVILNFVDGARAELGAGTGGRVDVMQDRSYVFTARGDVSARSGEGRELALNENTLPMTGGPVVEVKDANGQIQRVRLSPTVGVAVSGAPGSDYVVNVGGQEVRVGVGQSRTVTLPNGTGLVLTQDPSGGALIFAVSKGDFRLAVNGLEGTQIVGLTGQNGVLSWNVSDRWLDLGNGNGNTPMIVGLPGGASAGVSGQGGGRFALREGTSFEAQARGTGLTVVAEGLPGWSAQVPGDNRAGFVVNPGSRLVDVTAGSANKAPVVLGFIDGAQVELAAGTGGRADSMQDRSYVFTARGNVSGRTADGRELTLNENSLPLTGGPMVDVKDANGQVQRVRLSPTVGVAVSGAPGSDYVVNVGGQEVRLGVGQSRTVTLPNGTGLILTQDPSGGDLIFAVSKGDFRLAVNGLEGTQVVGLTGQNGVLSWNVSDRWVDVGNGSGGSPIIVGLPGGASAGVAGQGGGRFSLRGNSSFEAQARGTGITVVAAGMAGWSTQVPGDDTALFALNPASQLADVTAGANNKVPVVMNFIDGAQVELRAGTGGRADVLLDHSYVFTPRGRVVGRTADGRAITLNQNSLPLTGGPTITMRDANGTLRTVKLDPSVHVVVSGNIGSDVVVRVGDRTVTLDQSTPQTVTLANGATLTLSQNAATRSVNWHVGKGDFRVSVDGIGGWEAVGLTGLSAAMAWNVDTLTVALAIDITNTSASDPANVLLVGLPANVTARVAPGATFQYAGEVNSNDFQTSSHGGTVVLANGVTGQEVDLEAGSMAFAGGRPLMRGGALRASEPVTLAFNANSDVDVAGYSGNLTVAPGATKVVRGRDGSLLQVSNQPGGGLLLESISGDFSFSAQGARSGTITIPEGSTMSVAYDPAGGIFTAVTRRGRATVDTGDGNVRNLTADTMMTVIGGRLTTSSARPQDDIVFFESLRAGGRTRSDLGNSTLSNGDTEGNLPAGDSATGLNWPITTTYPNNLIDISRINQPPASPTGRP